MKFGERVLEIVEGCTDTDAAPKPPWRVRKEQYVTRIAHEPPSVLLVSIADKLHNVRALATDSRAVGDALWRRFNPEAGRDGTLGYYRGLVIAYSHRIKHVGESRLPFLVEALEREVSTLEARVGTKAQWPPQASSSDSSTHGLACWSAPKNLVATLLKRRCYGLLGPLRLPPR